MSLVNRLFESSFKGIRFLVENSSISFGQKTVVHEYPNSNKSEVEFLGLALDEFTLDIYINSLESEYIDKRNSLKIALSEGKSGILVHPYEGEVYCSVIGQVTLMENDKNFGLAKFSVTFKKTTSKILPVLASNNTSIIRENFNKVRASLLSFANGNFLTNPAYPQIFTDAKTRLTTLSNDFKDIQSIVTLKDTAAESIKRELDRFIDNIVPSSQNGEDLSTNLDTMFQTIDNPGVNDFDNLTVYQSLFVFGDDVPEPTPVSVEQETRNSNNKLMRQYVQGHALSLAYNSMALIDFEDDTQLQIYKDATETQFAKIIDDLDGQVRVDLISLRNQIRIYENNLDLQRVIDVTVPGNPLVKIVFLEYGDIDNFDKIYLLNNKADPSYYIGSIKLLANA
ncbi:MAG: DNA circularization N-terminal domain-containing protein [Candidatus Pacebacteria bacterium]|nr:DNA circularization N-terminal domain-containing protein [Candidatus Paceibacterota bacterium]